MAPADCPELEDIAALLDGKLGAKERARIAEHLASCESCYQVFAGAAAFLDDSREGGPEERSLPLLLLPEESWEQESQPPASEPSGPQRPFDRRREARAPRSRGWWAAAALAASLAVAAGLLLLRWQSAGELSTEKLASLAGGPAAIAKVPWEGRVTRGPEEHQDLSPDKEAFRLGVRSLDLYLALASGDRGSIDKTLPRFNSLLRSIYLAPADLVSAFETMGDRLRHGTPPRSFLPAAAAWEKKAVEELAIDSSLVELGRWTEACRLAGASGKPDLFRERRARRLLDLIVAAGPQDEDALLAPDAVAILRGIREDIAAGRIHAAALGQRCESLLKELDYDY